MQTATHTVAAAAAIHILTAATKLAASMQHCQYCLQR
jgi:hypothetical protein